MRGYPKFNFPAFDFAAQRLREQKFEVFSPAEKGAETVLAKHPNIQDDEQFRRKVFRMDTDWICRHADAVALLPGWETSAGAKAERVLAEALGLTIIILGKEYINGA
jgi:hypothetical protein